MPQRAVQQNQSIQICLYCRRGQQDRSAPVKTGERVGDDWIIEQGLSPAIVSSSKAC